MADVFLGTKELDAVSERLAALFEPVLVVTGEASYELSGARELLTQLLKDKRQGRFAITSRLPGPEAISDWTDVFGDARPGTVVAVGGGRVIDCAKLIALSATNEGILESVDMTAGNSAVPIVAIPTTGGSGSERTPFAVSYRDGVKYSIEHPSLLPVVAFVMPELTHSMSAPVTAETGLDALAHSIESCWAVRSTLSSRSVSLAALAEIWSVIQQAVEGPSPRVRAVMAIASSNAGHAIASTRTTAAHALSYSLTAAYGVAHGVAVALTLGALLQVNGLIDEDNCQDPRGPRHVRAVIGEICGAMGYTNADDAAEGLATLLVKFPIPSTLTEVGIRSDADRLRMAGAVNLERLRNNPRVLELEDLVSILERAG